MTALDLQLRDHAAKRPAMPRPFTASSFEAIAFRTSLQKWLDDGDTLERRLDLRNRQSAGKARAQRARGAA